MFIHSTFLFLIFLLLKINLIDSVPLKLFHHSELYINLLQVSSNNQPENHFSYDDSKEDGPSHWKGTCNTGLSQSPIAYDQAPLVVASLQNPLRMIGSYNVLPSTVSVINTGHGATFSLKYPGILVPQITGGPLNNDVYNFASFHFHYPCEHIPNKFSTACKFELHYVHFNAKYGSLENAASKSDGLAVIGVLYQIATKKLSRSFPFLQMLKHAYKTELEYSEKNNLFTYEDAIGFNTFPKYISYKGSLTTPTCSESVTWIVLDNLYPMFHHDLKKFQKIRDTEGHKLRFNNRPVQPINGRSVFVFN